MHATPPSTSFCQTDESGFCITTITGCKTQILTPACFSTGFQLECIAKSDCHTPANFTLFVLKHAGEGFSDRVMKERHAIYLSFSIQRLIPASSTGCRLIATCSDNHHYRNQHYRNFLAKAIPSLQVYKETPRPPLHVEPLLASFSTLPTLKLSPRVSHQVLLSSLARSLHLLPPFPYPTTHSPSS